MILSLDVRVLVALCSALGVCLLTVGVLRWHRRQRMHDRLRALATERRTAPPGVPDTRSTARDLASRVGAWFGERLPGQLSSLAGRVEHAGLTGGMPIVELLGWKIALVAVGLVVGLAGLVRFGAPGLLMLMLGLFIGWFGIDVILARYHAQRRRAILRDLPTTMDLLVLSLEAGLGLDRALRTVIREYRSALSEEIQRVLGDIDLGTGRGEAFERMALRVGLEDLRALSRAIVQSDELGVSLVRVMEAQAREVRLSRRRAAEAEALRAPIKMLIPLVVFILPTLFMLLLGPVALRAGDALSGVIR